MKKHFFIWSHLGFISWITYSDIILKYDPKNDLLNKKCPKISFVIRNGSKLLLLFFRKTLSSKVDLIWHLRPIRKVENARTLILCLSYFLQKLHFYDQKTDLYVVFWSQPQFLMRKHFFIWSHLGFISWRIYSLLWRVRHNSKIWPKKRPSK